MTAPADRETDRTGSRRFFFVVEDLPETTFALVSFEGREALSEPYVLDALLASDNPDIDTEALLSKPARLSMAASTRLGPRPMTRRIRPDRPTRPTRPPARPRTTTRNAGRGISTA